MCQIAKIVTAEEMAELDRHTIEDLKTPSLTLMENAGQAVAEEAIKLAHGPKIVIICGKGNNGGDGFVAARYLLEKYFDIKVIHIGKKYEVKDDTKINIERLESDVIEIVDLDSFGKVKPFLKDADLIIDSIFGIGLNTTIKSPYFEIITYINSLNKDVLAVDVPSGLNATTGEAMGISIKAKKTVTFAAAKTGFCKNDGPKYCGEIKVIDIGIEV